MDDARHFFPFLPVAFGLGIAIYFVWPSEPGFYYLAILPILLAVWRAPAGNYDAYVKSGIIFCVCLMCGAGWAHLHSYRASQNWAMPLLPAFMIGLIWLCLVQSRVRWCGLAAMIFAVLSLGASRPRMFTYLARLISWHGAPHRAIWR